MKNISYAIMVIALIAILFASVAVLGSTNLTYAFLLIGLVFVLAVGFVLGMAVKRI